MEPLVILGLIGRHLATALGGALVTQGLATTDQTTAISGGVLALVGVVMSYLNKKKK